jgi:hypothetical protein
MSFTQSNDNFDKFEIVNFTTTLDELMSDNGYSYSYYPLGVIDEVLDLKVGESMYIEPDYDGYIGKGIILRIN